MKRLFDERQEQESLKAKRLEMCVIFWIVAVSLVIKTYVLNLPFGYWVTEFIVIMIAAVLGWRLEAGKGMFDPYFKPTGKNCLLLSLAGALPVAIAHGIGKWIQYPEHRAGVFASAAFIFLTLLALIYLLLLAMAAYAKHQQRKLDEELEGEDNGEE